MDGHRAKEQQGHPAAAATAEYGYCYQSAAVVPDGSEAPAPAADVRVYQPGTRPGSPLPHAWIDDEDDAARQLAAAARLPLDAARIARPVP